MPIARVFIHCFVLAASWLALACASTSNSKPNGAGGPTPTVAQPEPAIFPQMHLVVHNFDADEGEEWSHDLRPDGAFVSMGSMSNGGSEHTVWRCHGMLSPDVVALWLERLKAEATHEKAPQLPSATKALNDGQNLGFVIGLRTEESIRYANPTQWSDDLEMLFGQLQEAKSCETFTESE